MKYLFSLLFLLIPVLSFADSVQLYIQCIPANTSGTLSADYFCNWESPNLGLFGDFATSVETVQYEVTDGAGYVEAAAFCGSGGTVTLDISDYYGGVDCYSGQWNFTFTPAPEPTEQELLNFNLLMGLAGILCASMLVYAFLSA